MKAICWKHITWSYVWTHNSSNISNLMTCIERTTLRRKIPKHLLFRSTAQLLTYHYCVEAQKNRFWSQTYQVIRWMLLPLSQRQLIVEFLWRSRKKYIPTFTYREVKTQSIYGLSENIHVHRDMHCTLLNLVFDTRCKAICVSMQFVLEECFNRKRELENPSIYSISAMQSNSTMIS